MTKADMDRAIREACGWEQNGLSVGQVLHWSFLAGMRAAASKADAHTTDTYEGDGDIYPDCSACAELIATAIRADADELEQA